MNIILIGFMGAGKTTVAKYLAEQNNLNYVDTDELIEKNSSMLIKDIFKNHGEEHFRILERDTISALKNLKDTIISVGGGAIMFHNNLEKLKSIGCVIFLNTPIQQIFLNIEGAFRPLIGENPDKDKILALYESRLPTYMEADVVINTKNLSISEISELIVAKTRAILY